MNFPFVFLFTCNCIANQQLLRRLRPSPVTSQFSSHCRLWFVFSSSPLPSPSTQLCVGLRAAELCGERSKNPFAFKNILSLCSKGLIQVTIPCCPLWNVVKRLQFPSASAGIHKISPYEISKRGQAAGLQPLSAHVASQEPKMRRGLLDHCCAGDFFATCCCFHKAAAFYNKVGKISCFLSKEL